MQLLYRRAYKGACRLSSTRTLSGDASSLRTLRQAYDELGLDVETATIQDVQARHAQLARQLHPDTAGEKVCPY